MTEVRYDLDAELGRYAFEDVERGGVRLNRGTVSFGPLAFETPDFDAVRREHRGSIVPTTLAVDSPVIELDRPATGIYVASRVGVYLDLYQGVAQRLFDDARTMPRLRPLVESGLLLRREINTDDYLGFAPDGVVTPQDLAGLLSGAVGEAFPYPGGHRVFFSNSGTEAIEAALKAATRHAFLRFLGRHGEERWAQVCSELNVERDAGMGSRGWRDYPLFVIALDGAFHGRTLGALGLTRSRPGQKAGFPTWRWLRHVRPREPGSVDGTVDFTPIEEVLAEPGQLAETVRAGRVSADLLAGAIYEPMQGEGGYRMTPPATLRALAAVCRATDGLLIADEVQTFARGGATFMSELAGVRPDVVCLAKAAIVGATLIPARISDEMESGWHSNTFGGGKLFDVNYAHAIISTFLHERDPLFLGLSFAENERVKGRYLAEKLDAVAGRHPGIVSEIEGAGCMWGFTTADRPAFVREAWRQGAKVLGAGAADEPGRLRIILPADVLTREIDHVADAVERTAAALEGRH